MSRRYAKAAVTALQADAPIAAWATGGILDRDPRRSGPNATDSAFTTTPDGDILPVIGVVGALGTKANSRIGGALADGVEVRIFAPDYAPLYDGMDMVAERIIRILNGYRASNTNPGIFQYGYRLGIQNGGAFEGAAYEEIQFDVLSIYPRLETA